MRIVLFLDLDDTILQTAPKCPPGQPLATAAVDRAGRALSFMTRAQQRLLTVWQEQGTVIPVTGRTEDALARVAIAFTSWRITHHGAVIRQPDGQLPGWWYEEFQPRLVAAQADLRDIADSLKTGATTGNYRISSHTVEQHLSYVSVKSDEHDGEALVRLRRQLEAVGLPPGLVLHHNGNNFALMVRGAQKQDAVRRVIQHLQEEKDLEQELEQDGPLLTIGAGDSLTDIPFLRVCDFALVPRNSQIQQETWEPYP